MENVGNKKKRSPEIILPLGKSYMSMRGVLAPSGGFWEYNWSAIRTKKIQKYRLFAWTDSAVLQIVAPVAQR